MIVKIAHASIDEHGKVSGGAAGDQTGKEVCIRSWYSYPWSCVIRFKDPGMRKRLADCLIRAANNVRIGYDWMNRNSLLRYARNVNYDPFVVSTPCETDCSALMTLACIYAGIPESALVVNENSATTRTLRAQLEATGTVEVFTSKDYTTKSDKLLVGDILLAEGHHTAGVVAIEGNIMKTSQAGINLIKRFEGCRLQAYKAMPSEKCYTIGYGHYGSDVTPGMSITQAQADALLAQDLLRYEAAVSDTGLKLNQSQFDALVSFAYNCGCGNLRKLVTGRDLQQIADSMLLYNKSDGTVLSGLMKRRQAERDMFVGKKIYPEPTRNLQLNSRGDDVRWLQQMLNKAGDYGLIIDGHAGQLTIGALKHFQKKAFPDNPKEWDGICGQKTREKLKMA